MKIKPTKVAPAPAPTEEPSELPPEPSEPIAQPSDLDPEPVWQRFIARYWPRSKATMPAYGAELARQGYEPADGPLEEWAVLEARGRSMIDRVRERGMSTNAPGGWDDERAAMRQGPVAEFNIRLIMARGKVEETRIYAAYAAIYFPDEYLRIAEDGDN